MLSSTPTLATTETKSTNLYFSFHFIHIFHWYLQQPGSHHSSQQQESFSEWEGQAMIRLGSDKYKWYYDVSYSLKALEFLLSKSFEYIQLRIYLDISVFLRKTMPQKILVAAGQNSRLLAIKKTNSHFRR